MICEKCKHENPDVISLCVQCELDNLRAERDEYKRKAEALIVEREKYISGQVRDKLNSSFSMDSDSDYHIFNSIRPPFLCY